MALGTVCNVPVQYFADKCAWRFAVLYLHCPGTDLKIMCEWRDWQQTVFPMYFDKPLDHDLALVHISTYVRVYFDPATQNYVRLDHGFLQ